MSDDTINKLLELARGKEITSDPELSEAHKFLLHFGMEAASEEESIKKNAVPYIQIYMKYYEWSRQNKRVPLDKNKFASQIREVLSCNKNLDQEGRLYYIKNASDYFDMSSIGFLRAKNLERKYRQKKKAAKIRGKNISEEYKKRKHSKSSSGTP